jgi:diacylglycerol kinase
MTEPVKPDPGLADDHTARVHPYAQHSFLSGMKHAWHGVLHVFAHEKNARIHLIFAVCAFVLGVALRLTDEQLAVVVFAIIIVFLAEIFNTAIERTLDLIDIHENPRIKLIKDMSAGGVLVAAVGAILLGVAIFFPAIAGLLWAR